MSDWQADVLAFWFGLDPKQWFKADEQLDADIRERFRALWEEQRQRTAEAFLASSEDALAALILFDQLPRNMFRGDAKSFASDPLARAIATAAVERGYDQQVPRDRRGFFYLPFEHSESIEDQDKAIALFTALGDAEMLRYARLHHDVIARFGRFPHRNAALGREPTPEEQAAGDVKPF